MQVVYQGEMRSSLETAGSFCGRGGTHSVINEIIVKIILMKAQNNAYPTLYDAVPNDVFDRLMYLDRVVTFPAYFTDLVSLQR